MSYTTGHIPYQLKLAHFTKTTISSWAIISSEKRHQHLAGGNNYIISKILNIILL